MRQVNKKDAQTTGQCWQLWLDGAADLVKVWELPASYEGIGQWQRQREHLKTARGAHFYGATEPVAREIVLKGWPQGAKLVRQIADAVEKIVPPPKSRRRVKKWSDDGDEYSYERQQQGKEYCWQSSHRRLRSAVGLVELIV